jgi:hypothetical protein
MVYVQVCLRAPLGRGSLKCVQLVDHQGVHAKKGGKVCRTARTFPDFPCGFSPSEAEIRIPVTFIKFSPSLFIPSFLKGGYHSTCVESLLSILVWFLCFCRLKPDKSFCAGEGLPLREPERTA